MKRTRKSTPTINKAKTDPKLQELLGAYATLRSASLLRSQMGGLGMQKGEQRDLYQIFGYPTEPTYTNYWNLYSRQDIAGAIINRPVHATWGGRLLINDPADENNTLGKEWLKLLNDLGIKNKLVRADKLSSLGNYGILFLGFSDAKTKDELKGQVKKGTTLKLNYLKPYGQDNAKVNKYVTDTANPRFGFPELYDISIKSTEGEQSTITVHWERVLHLTGELLEDELNGVPALQRVYNRLLDLQKLTGGSAEMFWRGARPGMAANAKDDYTIDTTAQEAIMDQIAEYENDLRRVLTTEGVDWKEFQQQIADPSKHVEVQVSMIAAETEIPKRILMGSEVGELASSQDRNSWLGKVKERREEYAEPNILRPLVDRLIAFKVLPEPKEEYMVIWEDLFSPSAKEKAEVGRIVGTALNQYSQNFEAQAIFPSDLFLKKLIDLSDEEIKELDESKLELIDPEETITEEEEEIIEEED